MTIEMLQQIKPDWEEVLPIGRDVQDGERLCHIVGMTRTGEEAALYLLEPEEEEREEGIEEKKPEERLEKERPEEKSGMALTNRNQMKLSGRNRTPMFLKGIRIGELELKTKSANSGPLILDDRAESCLEALVLFYEMSRVGWRLPEGHPFLQRDWGSLFLTRLEFSLEKEIAESGLPSWEGKEAVLRFDKSHIPFWVEQPVCLEVGAEQEVAFTLEDGRKGVCFINRMYLMDVWKEQEEKFADPRYTERFSEEELEAVKQQFYEALEQSCPKGMCYLGIEYECSLEGSLIFYEKAFLDRKPETHSGSASMLMLLLRPEKPTGSHGRKLYGSVVQAPLLPDTKQVEVELFQFLQYEEARELVC